MRQQPDPTEQDPHTKPAEADTPGPEGGHVDRARHSPEEASGAGDVEGADESEETGRGGQQEQRG